MHLHLLPFALHSTTTYSTVLCKARWSFNAVGILTGKIPALFAQHGAPRQCGAFGTAVRVSRLTKWCWKRLLEHMWVTVELCMFGWDTRPDRNMNPCLLNPVVARCDWQVTTSNQPLRACKQAGRQAEACLKLQWRLQKLSRTDLCIPPLVPADMLDKLDTTWYNYCTYRIQDTVYNYENTTNIYLVYFNNLQHATISPHLSAFFWPSFAIAGAGAPTVCSRPASEAGPRANWATQRIRMNQNGLLS